MDKKTGKVKRNFLDVPDFVNDIYEYNHKIIWIGCNGGLYCYNRENGKLTRFDNEDDEKRKLTATSINKIIKDKYDNLWVSTWDGLNKIIFKPDNLDPDTIIRYKKNPSELNSLSENRIISLHEDNMGNIWIGTYA